MIFYEKGSGFAMMDITTIGEVLIDLTQTGVSPQNVPLFASNPGGTPANVAVSAARLGAKTADVYKRQAPRSRERRWCRRW